MPRPVHFEIPVDNPERAAAFYRNVFGWKIEKWEGPIEYWNVTTGEAGPGINGGIMRRQHPQQPCVNTIGVDSLEETVATVEKNGGQIAVPKMAIPGVGWLAYCKDLDGHIFGVLQPDSSAR
ncbi:MAG: VOC family protein [Acidobacteriia bacterium]|nr:VOC family protein [Terriglobia bacterium]